MDELAVGLLAEVGILAVVVGVGWRMINSVRADVTEEMQSLRKQVRDLENKVQDQNGRRLETIEAEIRDREDKHHALEGKLDALQMQLTQHIARHERGNE